MYAVACACNTIVMGRHCAVVRAHAVPWPVFSYLFLECVWREMYA